ncbi:MarR family transcriptional regulator [Cupriavidus sp. UYMMa02A]|nr:MarR family transcriptional regulator [Cupriavidus sp. UYMU48A]ODV41989.1 MarR family transcriptional regulator [Cupriavidus sp. UYMMa02A]
MQRLLILLAVVLSALASELGGAAHRCVWTGTSRVMRAQKDDREEA